MFDITFNKSRIAIAQFADLHFGESEALDDLTVAMMRRVLAKERPDFAVFSGDIVSGYAVLNRRPLWQRALSVAAEFQVPFATIFGNHDDQPYRLDTLKLNCILTYLVFALAISAIAFASAKKRLRIIIFVALAVSSILLTATAPSYAARLDLSRLERQSFSTLSHTRPGGDYRLLFDLAGDTVALLFIDSGGGRIPEAIQPQQVEWLSRQVEPGSINSTIAFVHIPPFASEAYSEDNCVGPPPLEPTSSLLNSELLLDALAAINVSAVFSGHDHGNSYCCNRRKMQLCYGRHSGYGGYVLNSTRPGVRLIEIDRGVVQTWVSFA